MDILGCEKFFKSNLLIEQHFHGAYGVDFNTCETEDILFLSKQMLKHGIGGFFPTLVTDEIENIKLQIKKIKQAKNLQTNEMADILGIHLEGIFINPEKKGIHDKNLFLKPTVDNYKLIEDDFIKIVTLAPELDENFELSNYLTKQGVIVQAGHCTGHDLRMCKGVTHLFNAMSGVEHRAKSTALSALIDDYIYTEIIADGQHLSEDIIELVFKCKLKEKIILVSDSLPLTKSNLKEMVFAGEKIFFNEEKATSQSGTIAGSTTTLDEIIARLAKKSPANFEDYAKMASDNLYKYHNIRLNGEVYWNEEYEITAVEKDGIAIYRNIE